MLFVETGLPYVVVNLEPASMLPSASPSPAREDTGSSQTPSSRGFGGDDPSRAQTRDGLSRPGHASAPVTTTPPWIWLATVLADAPTAASIVLPNEGSDPASGTSPPEDAAPVFESNVIAP